MRLKSLPTWAEYEAILRTDFPSFVHKSFAELNPGTRLQDNWHVEAMCHALSMVMSGQINRLIINAPPRLLKSHIGSVALPAWWLGKNPAKKFICVSYSQDLATKHA